MRYCSNVSHSDTDEPPRKRPFSQESEGEEVLIAGDDTRKGTNTSRKSVKERQTLFVRGSCLEREGMSGQFSMASIGDKVEKGLSSGRRTCITSSGRGGPI